MRILRVGTARPLLPSPHFSQTTRSRLLKKKTVMSALSPNERAGSTDPPGEGDDRSFHTARGTPPWTPQRPPPTANDDDDDDDAAPSMLSAVEVPSVMLLTTADASKVVAPAAERWGPEGGGASPHVPPPPGAEVRPHHREKPADSNSQTDDRTRRTLTDTAAGPPPAPAPNPAAAPAPSSAAARAGGDDMLSAIEGEEEDSFDDGDLETSTVSAAFSSDDADEGGPASSRPSSSIRGVTEMTTTPTTIVASRARRSAFYHRGARSSSAEKAHRRRERRLMSGSEDRHRHAQTTMEASHDHPRRLDATTAGRRPPPLSTGGGGEHRDADVALPLASVSRGVRSSVVQAEEAVPRAAPLVVSRLAEGGAMPAASAAAVSFTAPSSTASATSSIASTTSPLSVALLIVLPTIFLLSVLGIFRTAPLPLCGQQCPCNAGDATSFTLFYYMFFRSFPRCLVSALLLQIIVKAMLHDRAARDAALEQKKAAAAAATVRIRRSLEDESARRSPVDDDRGMRGDAAGSHGEDRTSASSPPLFPPFQLPTVKESLQQWHVLTLLLSSIGVDAAVYGIASQLGLDDGFRVPTWVFAVIIPPMIFAGLKGCIFAAAPVILLQINPAFISFIVPQYNNQLATRFADTLLPVWPGVVALLDRFWFYLAVAAMPESAPPMVRLISAHLGCYYSQGLLVAGAMSLDPAHRTTQAAVFGTLLVLLEFLLSTHYVDRALLQLRNYAVGCVCRLKQRRRRRSATGLPEQEGEEGRVSDAIPPGPSHHQVRTVGTAPSSEGERDGTTLDADDRAAEAAGCQRATFHAMDERLLSAYVRIPLSGMVCFAGVPFLALSRTIIKIDMVDCYGAPTAAAWTPEAQSKRWTGLGFVTGLMFLVAFMTAAHRKATGAWVAPIVLPPPWSIIVGAYMVVSGLETFRYMS